MFRQFLLVCMFFVISISVSGDSKRSKTETLEQKQERIDETCAQILEEGEPEPIDMGPYVILGNATKWVINNMNKPDGWSLTGYADLKIKDSSYNRWKFGIINGELDWSLYQELEDRRLPRHELLEEWNMRRNRDAVFGFVFTREF